MFKRHIGRYKPGDLAWGKYVPLMWVLAIQTGVLAEPPQYRVLISPAVEGIESSYPSCMSDRGHILSRAGTDPFDPSAAPLAWFRGDWIGFETPTESLNFLLGVNASGVVVGSSFNLPYLWKSGRPHLLMPAGGFPSGFAYDINDGGEICGSVINDLFGEEYAAYWPSGFDTGTLLPGFDGAPGGSAFAINNAGQIAGVSSDAFGNFLAARWDDPADLPVQIGPIDGATSSEVVEINESGDTVGRSTFSDGTTEAMLHLAGANEVVGLGFLGGSYSFANGMNNIGQVVGTASTGTEVHAFLWEAGVLYDLNELIAESSGPFDYLANAVAIDDSSVIAAEVVIIEQGVPHSRVARLVPISSR